MRKTLVVALREYNAAVRTKAFVLGLLIMPVLMGGGLIAQRLLGGYRDTRDRRYAVVDRTGGQVAGWLKAAVREYNDRTKDETGTQVRPAYVLLEEAPPANTQAAVDEKRVELSNRVRRNELAGFVEVGPEVLHLTPTAGRGEVRYQSNRLTEREFPDLVQRTLARHVPAARAPQAKVDAKTALQVAAPVPVGSHGLSVRDAATDEVRDDDAGRVASVIAPVVLMMLMFMLVLMTTTPLMQGVVEEKMQRIAEVLLGSVTPFQLMLGKLLGMTAVSLTISAFYLAGAYWAAHRFGVSEYATPQLVAWFLLYQTLAALMYGSLFIAVGAACTDLRETQSLLWPVMLLAVLPMFVLGNVIREPNSTVVMALSFFPFATPTLMIGRQSLPPGVAWWEPVVGCAGVLLTTLVCVWAAGRIFRVGLLLQGKGANPAEIARWVFRG